jgi:hypothetical protein
MGDCQTFHYDVGRLGQGEGAAIGSTWHKQLAISLGSAVRGAPLTLQGWVVQEGPRASETHNMVYIATSDNHVNAYAEDQLLAGNTTPFWSVSCGPPVQRGGSNIPAFRNLQLPSARSGQFQVVRLFLSGRRRWNQCL